jgi:peptidoglycan hydrolase FlgJ
MSDLDFSNASSSQLEMSRNVNDIQGLDTLRRAAQSGDKAALQEAAQQFEGIFIQMMLKSMRKAQDVMADENSPFNSEQVKFYRDMHDQQLANDIASRGSMGLASVIVQQLGQLSEGYMPASAVRNDGNLSGLNRHTVKMLEAAQQAVLPLDNNASNSPKAYKAPAFSGPQDFAEQLLPAVEFAAAQLGLEPKALLAQAAVETGWGQHMIHRPDGTNSHNLFGIKAGKDWQGDKVLIDSVEFEQGVANKQKSPFRVYASFADSLQDYVDFVKQQPRYQHAVANSGEAQRYFAELQQAGYATDPEYSNKISRVMASNTLQELAP